MRVVLCFPKNYHRSKMKTYLIICILAILEDCTIGTGEKDKVTFFEDARRRGASTTYTYEDKCVTMPNDWQNRARSIEPYNKCIVLYDEPNCKGHRRIVSIGSYMQFLLNMETKVSSFKKCTSDDIQIKLDERPLYYIMTYDQKDFLGNNYAIEIKSDECKNLSPEWRNRISSIMTLDQCYVFYDNLDCKGNKKYVIAFSSPSEDMTRMNFDKLAKSVEPCDLTFKPTLTNKFIERGSAEYNFWKYLFSILSRQRHVQFETETRLSTNGFISWSFLFAKNTSASTSGHQYQDAFENLFVLLRYLMLNRPGRLGFNTLNIETLSDLSLTVYNERTSQKENYEKKFGNNDWTDHNHAVFIQTWVNWYWLKWYFSEIAREWNPENGNDVCGLVESRKQLHNTRPLISEGYLANYGDDPWHAAIFRRVAKDRDPILICGATIISRTIVLSAAHCFYSDSLTKALNNTSEYEIYVGKFTSTYSTKDNNSQKIHKVRELIFNPNGYNPTLTKTYGSDIILISLEEPLTFNEHVRPVCLDWDGSVFENSSPLDKQLGRVVGWGTTDPNPDIVQKANEYLLVAELPYVTYSDCLGKVEHITSDKFCAGADKGPAVRLGDSGGGYVFKYINRYYIRGIVSTRDTVQTSSFATFTDVSFYISWIRQYI